MQASCSFSHPGPLLATQPHDRSPMAASGSAVSPLDKDHMLQEKDKQIEELTRMLKQKQRLVETLRSQLEQGKRGAAAEVTNNTGNAEIPLLSNEVEVTVKEEIKDEMDTTEDLQKQVHPQMMIQTQCSKQTLLKLQQIQRVQLQPQQQILVGLPNVQQQKTPLLQEQKQQQQMDPPKLQQEQGKTQVLLVQQQKTQLLQQQQNAQLLQQQKAHLLQQQKARLLQQQKVQLLQKQQQKTLLQQQQKTQLQQQNTQLLQQQRQQQKLQQLIIQQRQQKQLQNNQKKQQKLQNQPQQQLQTPQVSNVSRLSNSLDIYLDGIVCFLFNAVLDTDLHCFFYRFHRCLSTSSQALKLLRLSHWISWKLIPHPHWSLTAMATVIWLHSPVIVLIAWLESLLRPNPMDGSLYRWLNNSLSIHILIYGRIPNGSEHSYSLIPSKGRALWSELFEGCRALLSRMNVWNSLGEGNYWPDVTMTPLRVRAGFSASSVVVNKYFFLLIYSNIV